VALANFLPWGLDLLHCGEVGGRAGWVHDLTILVSYFEVLPSASSLCSTPRRPEAQPTVPRFRGCPRSIYGGPYTHPRPSEHSVSFQGVSQINPGGPRDHGYAIRNLKIRYASIRDPSESRHFQVNNEIKNECTVTADTFAPWPSY
jgi:hypothetical protein